MAKPSIQGVLYCDSRNNGTLHIVQGDEDAKNYWILRCAQNDEEAVLYSAENDEVAKKKEDSTVVESSFCGCQDSNLEPFGS